MRSQEKKALGKGLSALIADSAYGQNEENESSEIATHKSLRNVHISLLSPNIYQPRKNFPKAELQELANSIKQHGILQPITVRQLGDGYEIIAGERRTQAAKIAGLSEVPVIVKEYTDRESFELAIIENIQRENLNPLEEAMAYEKFSNEFNLTQEEIANKIGKSRAHVANMLRILKLPEDVKNLIAEGKISSGHARSLLNAPNISELALKIVNDNLSVRQIEQEVKILKNSKKDSNHDKKRHTRLIREGANKHFQKDTDLLELEAILSKTINMPVYINDTLDGGEVVLKFKSLEQLDWIIERLGNENLNF